MSDIAVPGGVARIVVYLDDDPEPYRTIVPPDSVEIDTTRLDDGPHVVRLHAYDAAGNVGRRTIPFMVQNGPGITVTGLRANERVSGRVALELNAFGGAEPFDPVRAESSGPIPVWTWVMIAVFGAWAVWYALAYFSTPAIYAQTPTYAANPVAAAQAPAQQNAPPKYSGKGTAGGFDYGARGEQLYAANCASCHGENGTGTPGVFPPLAGDPVVTAANPHEHITIVLHGVKGRAIKGTSYASQMPPFAQLSNDDIAAIVDHERTSGGNQAPIVAPGEVKPLR
jgi:mono/diheme cytochrome c family protein